MHHRLLLIPALLALGLLLPAAAAPQEDPAPGAAGTTEPVPALFLDVVDVSVVNVEVYVTDKDGNRVGGLDRDDFEVRVDGDPVTITNFYAVEEGQARTEAGLEMVPADRLAPEPAEPDEIPPDQRLHLIVYVDNFNLHPFTRNKALGFVRTFLRSRLRPGDEVMLVTYDRSPHLRHPFTKDPEIIASALYELEDLSAHQVHFDSDRHDIMSLIYESEKNRYQSVYSRVTVYAESLYSDLSFSIDALWDLTESLAGLPGRKAILYVSDGLAMQPGADAFYALYDHFDDSSILMEITHYDASRRFQSLVNQANANRVTFYTIDAAGLRTYTYLDASNMQAGGGAFIDQTHISNMQSTLQLMAEETGGIVIMNTNNFAPGLDRVAEDLASYYSLGFSSGDSTSGRYHSIEVRVKDDKKLRVRHREGFRDKPVAARMADTTMAALHYGYQENNLGVEIEVGHGAVGESGFYQVPLRIRIPLKNLNLLPQGDRLLGRVRIYLAARDAEGGEAPVQDIPVPFALARADLESGEHEHFTYQFTVQMRAGRQVIALGVRDEVGAETSFVTRGLTVGR